MKLHLDFETRSRADLKKVGAWAYSMHPSTEVMCVAFAQSEGPVRGRHGYNSYLDMAHKLTALLQSPEVLIYAHNCQFEYLIWNNVCVPKYGWPKISFARFRCTAAKASALALPRELSGVGEALNLPLKKDIEGRKLMLKMCKPDKEGNWVEGEELSERLLEYCKTDVEVERLVDNALPDLSSDEQRVFSLDFAMNTRGVKVDREFAGAAVEFSESYGSAVNEKLSRLTGGMVDAVSRVARIKEFLVTQGVVTESLNKAAIDELLKRQEVSPLVKQVLTLRRQAGKSSVAKTNAMLIVSSEEDPTLRGMFMYHGASTGRWTGKLVQLHNLPRGTFKTDEEIERAIGALKMGCLEAAYPQDPMGTISSAIRSAIMARPGNKFLCADYSAIEARVLLWMAGDVIALSKYRLGVDLYVDMAKFIYGKSDIQPSERWLGKSVILGCGYGMGWVKFMQTCANNGVVIDEELAKKAIKTYREKYKSVVQMWKNVESAAMSAIRLPGTVSKSGYVSWVYETTSNFLFCTLPSGRRLAYYAPSIKPITTEWGEEKDEIHFWGVHPKTKDWCEQKTYGGALTENIVQATARDIMVHGMFTCEAKGYPVVMTVHDEIVSEVPEDYGSVKDFEGAICTLPKWAEGCPVEAKGWQAESNALVAAFVISKGCNCGACITARVEFLL